MFKSVPRRRTSCMTAHRSAPSVTGARGRRAQPAARGARKYAKTCRKLQRRRGGGGDHGYGAGQRRSAAPGPRARLRGRLHQQYRGRAAAREVTPAIFAPSLSLLLFLYHIWICRLQSSTSQISDQIVYRSFRSYKIFLFNSTSSTRPQQDNGIVIAFRCDNETSYDSPLSLSIRAERLTKMFDDMKTSWLAMDLSVDVVPSTNV